MENFRLAIEYLLDGTNWEGPQGIGAFMAQQLLLTVTSLAIAVALGLPLAMWLGHLGKGGFLAINITNIGRAVPVFAVLIVLFNLIADILYGILDPRIRYE